MTATGELFFLTAGVRFTRSRLPSHTPDGHAITLTVTKVQGPRDEALMGALRAAVSERDLTDLSAARRRVETDRQAKGLPLDPRGGVPMGVCETCGDSLVSLKGDTITTLDYASGMCNLCLLARERVVMARQ